MRKGNDRGRWDTIHVAGSRMGVYLAWPEDAGEVAGVMLAQHDAGVDRIIEVRVDVLAAEGFLAAAPEFYCREPAAFYAGGPAASLMTADGGTK